jgi:hypothetical protein
MGGYRRWDCVHNLRSALDHLAIVLVRDGGGTPGEYTAFPISRDRTHIETRAIQRLEGASAAAIKIVKRLKPYPGGCNSLVAGRCN